eukprot:GHUV01019850.1.p1 GENE.GHUV01019850.1~~GHUV01019850.1.p1  ORF type:complete len:149 (+),score=41.46 GHUV01019850.1:260-706(+)
MMFLMELLSFTCRYIPIGLLEVVPQKISRRPPAYKARNQLEALIASEAASDWVTISERLLGPAPAGFTFAPKHKCNAYTVSDIMQQVIKSRWWLQLLASLYFRSATAGSTVSTAKLQQSTHQATRDQQCAGGWQQIRIIRIIRTLSEC